MFDLDGVLVDSRGVVERVWRRWAAARRRDPAPFLAVAHGRRISETLRLVAPELDWQRETAELDRMEETETEGLVAAPTAGALLRGLPATTWGIVTSGSPMVARLRLETTGLPIPRVFVTGRDVERGKPDPEGYRRGAERLGVRPETCVVVEDAPPGVAAARAAGMRVIAVLTTHPPERLTEADVRVADLGALRVTSRDRELRLELTPVAGLPDSTHTLPP